MCPSSWELYVDDFTFFGSYLAHLEPELELFEVDAKRKGEKKTKK